MSRIYTVEFENVSITNANGDYDLFELTPADDIPVRVLACALDVLSEIGDAQEEHLRLRWIRGHTTSGSGGSAATPRPINPGDAAASFTAEVTNSTIASVGTTVNLHSDGFNVRSGYQFNYDEKTAPQATQGNTTLVLRLMAAVTDDLTMSGTIWVEEL